MEIIISKVMLIEPGELYRGVIEKNNNEVEETEHCWEGGDFLKKI